MILYFSSHKIYRKLIKKLRRQFYRKQIARQRDEQIHLDNIQKQNDPLYQAWILHQENLRLQREIEEEQEMYWIISFNFNNYFIFYINI